jgi:LysR family glycine cleavage system transcriptional activator
MSVRAAVLGMGVALVPELVVESELQEGQLIVPLRHPFGTERAFYLVCPESKADNPVLRVFKDWLLTYAASMFADKVT